MSRCVALLCVVLRCVVLCCVALCCVVLLCVVLFCVVLCCFVLCCVYRTGDDGQHKAVLVSLLLRTVSYSKTSLQMNEVPAFARNIHSVSCALFASSSRAAEGQDR